MGMANEGSGHALLIFFSRKSVLLSLDCSILDQLQQKYEFSIHFSTVFYEKLALKCLFIALGHVKYHI